ncbi:uncharacterized protein [Eurosta solidaginis]|uniref:uncharacterized protein n=1 Tax=Eurosta solidaginis TaxID=178769 RepID=UPI0035307F96
MSQHGCLKISYHGNRRLVGYKLGSGYEEILETALQLFKIPCHRKSSLLFANAMGKIFSRRQLDSYLAQQPNPKITFYLRYKNNGGGSKTKPTIKTKAVIRISSTGAMTQTPKSLKRRRDNNDDGADNDDYDPSYPTTPVFRMNCFIGVYPSKCSPPPPEKRVRFSENLNSIRIIPARAQISDVARAPALPRTQSFYDGFGKVEQINSQEEAVDLTLHADTKQKISESTFKVEGSPMTQLACCSPLHRTKSFMNTLPAPQPLILNFFKNKTRRMLFANAQQLTE